MTYLQAILLGALQGLTEFLPVSSSGHLALLQDLLGVREVPLLFDVLLHVATLGVVGIVFREKILQLIWGGYRILRRESFAEQEEMKRLILALIVSTLCTGLLGLPLKHWAEQANPKLISLFFIFTAFLLLVAGTSKGGKTYKELSITDGIVIGLAQGIGVFPGISRSGITISAGLLRRLNRSIAGEYSFLLSIPAILGALILTIKDISVLELHISPAALIAGMGAAFLSGYFALTFLLKLIRNGQLGWFALYLIPLGIIGILFL
ncbi:MAG: undecaprenyl-diphosphate phosphatase [Spirochaetes bacterium]|nr:undecaprenyl-diphosphate phosphatase [Spirochaetota bacterium]